MARTKQTARKSTGGKAPRKHAVYRVFQKKAQEQGLTEQQIEEVAPREITWDLSYESAFFNHYFNSGTKDGTNTDKDFLPLLSAAASTCPLTGKTERYAGVALTSKFDGSKIQEAKRPIWNFIFVLDVSGSMSLNFQGEQTKSKLEVAKECLKHVFKMFKPTDSFGLVIFNDDARVIQPLTLWSETDRVALNNNIDLLRANGGTTITSGIESATALLRSAGETLATQRIFFLTDMEVPAEDGEQFIKLVSSNADSAIFSTITGIGLDLTSNVIEKVSKSRGCQYSNVRSTQGFREFVEVEFLHSVRPVAFNIQFAVASNHQIQKGYGTPEFNQLVPGGTIKLSTDFPSTTNQHGERRSGVLLMLIEDKKETGDEKPVRKQKKTEKKSKKRDKEEDKKNQSGQLELSIEHEDLSGIITKNLLKANFEEKWTMPTSGLRKAILLVRFTDFMLKYKKLRQATEENDLDAYNLTRKQFPTFFKHFLDEMLELEDVTLEDEVNNMKDLSKMDDVPVDLKAAENVITSLKKLLPSSSSPSSSPSSQDAEMEGTLKDPTGLDTLDRSTLQSVAKQFGLPANKKTTILIESIRTYFDQNEEQAGTETKKKSSKRKRGSSQKKSKRQKKSLTTSDESSDTNVMCCICLTTPKKVLLLPCKHLCLCSVCSPKVNTCPLCQGSIASKIDVYL